MQAVLKEREKNPFISFEDIKSRVHNIPDPEKTIVKRIYEELTQIQRQNLF